MPLTKKGSRIKAKFSRRYRKRGKGVFYATLNKNPGLRRAAEPKRARRRGRRRRR